MMRKAAAFLICITAAFFAWACGGKAEAASPVLVSKTKALAETVPGSPAPEATKEEVPREDTKMKIQITANGNTVIYELNDSQAAKDLYAQLPLTVPVENYSTNEKIFYPSQRLDTANAPAADGQKGCLAYFAPWGNVVMFYGQFEPSGSLYGLGEVISGEDLVETMSGTLEITGADINAGS